MYRLVVVEDERDVKNRLINMIEKSGSNFEIVSEYETGIDAYEGILNDNPDLILTDIKIPYINGIELSKKVREVFPQLKIIIITGYNEFDYAKEAANLGVIGFISKPVTLESLRSLLDKAAASLDSEYLTAANLSELSAFYESSLPIIREYDLYRLSKMPDLPPAFEGRLRSSGISLDYPYFLMCIFDFDEIPEGDAERYDIVFSSIRKSIGEDFSGICDFELFVRYEKLCFLIKSAAPPDIKEIERRLELIVLRIGRYSEMPVSAGVSRVFENCRNFSAMVKDAERALGYRSVMGGQKVFFSGGAEPRALHLAADEGLVKDLGYILHNRPVAECLGRIDAIRQGLARASDSVFYTAAGILNALVRGCDDLGGLCGRYGSLDDLHRKLLGLKTEGEIFDYLKDVARAIRSLNESVITDSVELSLRKVVAYMEAHYCDPDINFEALAREVNFSVSYISALLKKKTGASFVKMLTDLRMEKARELLMNPALKIIDVAEQLGYNDSYYFSHCFKKHVGVSPKEFRSYEHDKQAL